MDSIARLSQKILIERARQGTQHAPPIPDIAPPPYTAEEETSDDSDSDPDDSGSDDGSDDPPVKLTINAAHSIQGSNNLVPTSPSPLADASRFGALLLHAVHRINAAAVATAAAPQHPAKRGIRVDLTINCGVTVVGDRNVVGNVGLKPKSPERSVAGPGAQVQMQGRSADGGAKRKAEDGEDDAPALKRRGFPA